MKKIAVIGIGNPFVADDSAGILALRQLRRTVSGDGISFVECERGGLDLLDLMTGYDCAVLLDATRTGFSPPGSVGAFTLTDRVVPATAFSLHTINLGDVMDLGRAAGLSLPAEVTVIGVEAADTETFGAPCTPAVAAALPHIVASAEEALRSHVPNLQSISRTHETAPP